MKLQFLPLESLCVSPLNMRHGRKQPDLANLLPSVRKRGILQPLLVRPLGAACAGTRRAPGGGSDDGGGNDDGTGGQGLSPETPMQPGGPTHEILAGRRRYHAACMIAREARQAADSQDGSGTVDDGSDDGLLIEDRAIPCAILEDGDDAAALEASLLENAARLDPLGHVSRLSFDRKNKRMVCLFQAARSAYPKSWRRAAWNKHLRGGCGIVPLAIGGDESVTRTPLGLSARLSAPHI